MLNRDLELLHQLSGTVEQIAAEVRRAQPGLDIGLLPVNCLLLELNAAAAQLPPAINAAVEQALALVEGVLATAGAFDADSLQQLGDWTNWMHGAVRDSLSGRPIPPFAGATARPISPAPATADPPPVLDLVLDLAHDGELLAEFCAEAREHLQNIEQGVLVLERQPDDGETLSTLFRAFHTFKGGAGLLNLPPLKDLAHELENVLELARAGKRVVDPPIINLILAGADTCRQFIDEIGAQIAGRNAGAAIRIPIQDVLARARSLAPLATSPDTFTSARPPAPPSASSLAGGTKPARDRVVKVDTCKLDALIELVGELAIAQSQICPDGPVRVVESPHLAHNLAQLSRLTRELQHTALSLRMVPLRATFQKLTRLVRDVAGQQGKQVALLLHGEDTELDRTIVEQLGDPLMHMIRNSVDHGLEPPDERVRAGKPALGTVDLSAFHRGGNLVLQIRDDGRGLNPAKLKARAVELGVITRAARLTDQEAFALIFTAGFSTAETVTEISGRGVGMDVVRQNLEKVRGRIDIDSTPGRGTTFTLSLPLTLALIDGLIVTIGEQRFILPTLSVRETFRPTEDMLTTVPEEGELVKVRGRLSPLLRLHACYRIRPRTTDPTQALLIVVESHGETRCLMVDQILGRQEVVIKSLGEAFQPAPAIAGAAILGDGGVGLIIDPNSLARLHRPSPAVAA